LALSIEIDQMTQRVYDIIYAKNPKWLFHPLYPPPILPTFAGLSK